MALVDKLETMLPGWALDLSHWLQLGAAMALVIDALIEGAIDGVLAAMPGQIDAPSLGGFPATEGLAATGRDRRIPRGLAEPAWTYAAALRNFRAIHRRDGLPFGLLEEVRRILSPSPPRIRLVTGAGVWYTVEPDGTRQMHTPAGTGFAITAEGVSTPLTAPAHPWDWDGSTNPFRAFLIVYAPTGLIPDDEGTWGDGTTLWGDGVLWGIDSTLALVEQLRSYTRAAPAGVTIPWIIVAFDPASFDPETAGPYPAAGMPDGSWGRYGHLVGSDYVRTRLSTARYVRGTL
jgi:hypothetical protein